MWHLKEELQVEGTIGVELEGLLSVRGVAGACLSSSQGAGRSWSGVEQESGRRSGAIMGRCKSEL